MSDQAYQINQKHYPRKASKRGFGRDDEWQDRRYYETQTYKYNAGSGIEKDYGYIVQNGYDGYGLDTGKSFDDEIRRLGVGFDRRKYRRQ